MYSSQATIEVQQGATDDATASTAAGTHKFRVSGSPFTPKYYGSFQLQNDKDAGAQIACTHMIRAHPMIPLSPTLYNRHIRI